MLKANLRIIYIKLDKGKFTKDLAEVCDKVNKEAAREWLKAVITRVPVWTGEARGSLRPLGQFLRVAVPIDVSTSKWVKYAIAKGHTAEAGEAQGHFEFKIEENRRFIFEFSTDVVHYLINEYFDMNPPIHLINRPRPWASFDVGRAAYDAYLADNLKERIPNIKSYLIRETKT